MRKLLLILMCVLAANLHAEEILFLGNSFTYAPGKVQAAGGIPKLVEAIAAAKRKTAGTMMVAPGGKDWRYHLSNPDSLAAIGKKPWDWVVLQDQSVSATHVGNAADFLKDGLEISAKITEASPKAGIVLYQTWAYDARHPIYGKKDAKGFASPDEMTAEIVKNYAALLKALETKEPKRTVRLAPVGEAFARCVKEHPEISLCSDDFKHPSPEGSYLSALVLYATLFQDSPKGAPRTFSGGITFDPKEAYTLQDVAAAVTARP